MKAKEKYEEGKEKCEKLDKLLEDPMSGDADAASEVSASVAQTGAAALDAAKEMPFTSFNPPMLGTPQGGTVGELPAKVLELIGDLSREIIEWFSAGEDSK